MLIQAENQTPRPRLGYIETIVVDSRKIHCNGGSDTLGHPGVWLKIGDQQTVCPYCSRLFILQPE
ncbi:zinc-finger domain-containing protein [Acetobacter thailandicus]|uniref:zinc-finger domain-containing protein n=1 Tax=Acetobacter thailandicus TaxID=1502842 RepID=UPI001BA9CFA2|nr:zinc-finger domain-containing protein [Acetobacter thailandicus]MBS0959834.1 zinc-finger domain-containing protein [Acetobacter thailandicus]